MLSITADLSGEIEDRYHRQRLIDWWDQIRIREAKVLVIGAGALGNEILKLLALIGIGRTIIYDPDRIERSNLSRCVLFRDHDEGRFKADVAAERMRELNPGIQTTARCENIITHGGLGVFAWADVIIAGVDNREARVFVNSACARTGKRWVDGAIEGFAGVARVFDPGDGACYECTMNGTDRKLLAQRRSCALLARDIVARGHVPTTAVMASLVAALEVQEAVKLLHGQPALGGEGIHVQGLWGDFSRVRYPRRDDCMGHDNSGTPVALGVGSSDVTLAALLDRADAALGPGATLELSREVVLELVCPQCGDTRPGQCTLGTLREADAACPACGTHRIVDAIAGISRDGRVDLTRTPAELGLPPFDIIIARRELEAAQVWVLDGDAPALLGPLACTSPGNDQETYP